MVVWWSLPVIAYRLLTEGRPYRSAEEQAMVTNMVSPAALIGC